MKKYIMGTAAAVIVCMVVTYLFNHVRRKNNTPDVYPDVDDEGDFRDPDLDAEG